MSASAIHTRIQSAQAATLTLIEHTLAAATKALAQPDTPPATLRAARLAATAAARTLSMLANAIPDDPPPPNPPQPANTPKPHLPSGLTIRDLVAVLEASPPPPRPRSRASPSTPTTLLSRVGGLDPPRS